MSSRPSGLQPSIGPAVTGAGRHVDARLRHALVRLAEEDRQLFPGRVGLNEYLLEHGRSYPSASLTAVEFVQLRLVPGTRRLFRPRECFYNAQRLVADDTRTILAYVEGVAVWRGQVIVHHAWVTLNGKVIDVTWPTERPRRTGPLKDRIVGEFPAHSAYYGVEFTPLAVLRSLVENEAYQPLIPIIGSSARAPGSA